jgi:hypothetical protein
MAYLSSGLCVLPASREEKRPTVGGRWEPYKTRLPSEAEVRAWFANGPDAVCIVCGAVSGNLEMIDFDFAGELFHPWCLKVEAAAPGLVEKVVLETTQSSGWHVAYRCSDDVCGSLKLAQRKRPVQDHEVQVDDGGREFVTLHGKKYAVRVDSDGSRYVLITLVETRGEGGVFLCAPTAGYEVVQGDLASLPLLSATERDVLLQAAWELNEYLPPPDGAPAPSTGPSEGGRPGDEFNARGDVRDVLRRHGWTLVREGENEYWCRPGKERGWSATLRDRAFYCFSTNAPPLEANRAYSPFGLYALLEHGGDYGAAASDLRTQGYGSLAGPVEGVDLSCIVGAPANPDRALPGPLSLGELVARYPSLRAPLIEGLLREGETMNVISAPKTGKSWLAIDLALSVATGRPWLGMDCVPGEVLILDNELHAETTANRIPKVAAARGIAMDDVADRIYVESLRGRLRDLSNLGPYFGQFEPGRFKVVILDAFYRFLPISADENDNGTMANLYNYLDSFADRMKCSFVLIHHTSKGNQSLKAVTDVGAGAGAQSRATDTHLVLRPHQEDDAAVLEASVRSWPPVRPRCLRWAFPVWLPAEDLDPSDLEGKGSTAGPRKKDAPAEWDEVSFVEAVLGEEPKSQARVLEDAQQLGLSLRRTQRLLALAEESRLAFRWSLGPKGNIGFATVQPPDEQHATAREAVAAMLHREPDVATDKLAARCGVSRRYVQQIRRDLEAQNGAK